MPSPQEREETLFRAAVELPPGVARRAFLDQACAGDASLRQRLDALLAAHDEPEGSLATAAPAVKATMKIEFADESKDEAVGQTLGRYKLLERLGEGGCGVVYVAEQTEPVRRRVALKVIKLGMDTKQVVARFEAERQALAMMDHPNIAKVLDAGTTDVGRPYFVMELVRGIRITDYCDQANLATKERLDLFIKVCQAIQHAHQKGIIHRDIKPSNILVTLHDGVPVPKVIDFGIAKATEGRLTDATVYTQLHQFIGTPAYMSPEQAEMSGLDIDTRSDIYSLGVLLYELLAGSTPFDAKELMASGIDKMRKTIREKEPQRPSTRLATLGADELTTTAKRRSADTAKLLRQLKGDLDWIVMKCLEKDRQRRYETANGLAADLKRHLNNEPVVARPPSAAYKFQKSWHRNRVVYSASFAVAFALSVGLGVSIMQALRATREKRNAVTARVEADRNATDAIKARELAEGLKYQADAQALASRRRAYASDMLAAQKALAEDNLARTRMLLDRHRPTPEHEVDLRGWEWRYLWSQAQPDPHEILISGSGDREMFEIGFAGDAQRLGFWENGEIKILDLQSRQTRSVSSPAAGEVQRFFAFAHRHPWVFFATAKDGKITQHLYDFEAHKELIEPQASDGELLRSQFAPDDSVVIAVHRRVELIDGRSVNRGNSINAIDVVTGATLWTKPAPSFNNLWIDPLNVSPDGKAVAVIAPAGRLRIYELRDGRERFGPVKVAKEIALTVRFSPDSKSVLTTAGFGDTEISIWNAEDGTPAGRLEGHRGFVSSLVFTPDGRRLISGAGDYTIRTWDWDNRRLEATYRGHLDEVDRIALSPDGHTLVSECKDGSAYLWNLQTNDVRHAYRKFATAFSRSQIRPTSIEFMSDHRSIMALYANGQRQIWDLERLEISSSRRALPPRSWNNAPPPTYSPDGNQCARNLTNEQVVAVMDANTTREIARLPIRVDASPGGSADPGRLRYSTDGRMLVRFSGLSKDTTNTATNGRLQRIEVWSTSTWKLERQFDLFIDNDGDRTSPDNTLTVDNPLALEEPGLFAFISRGYIDVVDVKHPEPRLRRFSRPGTKDSWIEGFVVSRERNYAATTAQDGFLTVWDWDTGEVKQHFKAFRLGSHAVSRSQDGRRLAASSGGLEVVKIWDTETWDEVTTLGGEGSLFRVLKFSPDGRHIFAGSGIGGHLWTAPTMEEIEAAEAKATQSSQRVVNPFPAPKAPRQQPTQEPKNPGPLIRAGKYAEAAQVIRDLIKSYGAELDGDTGDGGTMVRVVLAATLLAAGERDGYRAACAEAVSRFRNATNSTHAGWIARTCLLAPDSGVDAASLAALMATAQSDKDKHWLQLLNALAEYRLGRWNTAADWAVQARTNADSPELCTPAAAAILAMAEHQQKRPDEARVALEAAKTAIAANGPTGITANWPEWLIADLLAKEAGALINKPAAAAKP